MGHMCGLQYTQQAALPKDLLMGGFELTALQVPLLGLSLAVCTPPSVSSQKPTAGGPVFGLKKCPAVQSPGEVRVSLHPQFHAELRLGARRKGWKFQECVGKCQVP